LLSTHKNKKRTDKFFIVFKKGSIKISIELNAKLIIYTLILTFFTFYQFDMVNISFILNFKAIVLSSLGLTWILLLSSFKTGHILGFRLNRKAATKATLYLLIITFSLFYYLFMYGKMSLILAATSCCADTDCGLLTTECYIDTNCAAGGYGTSCTAPNASHMCPQSAGRCCGGDAGCHNQYWNYDVCNVSYQHVGSCNSACSYTANGDGLCDSQGQNLCGAHASCNNVTPAKCAIGTPPAGYCTSGYGGCQLTSANSGTDGCHCAACGALNGSAPASCDNNTVQAGTQDPWNNGGTWSGDNSTQCCGDVANEFPTEKICSTGVCTSSSSDKACCYPNTDCSYSGICCATGNQSDVDSDGILELCTNTTWSREFIGNLTVNLTVPDPGVYTDSNPLQKSQNTTFDVTANVTCSGLNCSGVYGVVRYNASSAYPDTAINITSGAAPFYITQARVRPISYNISYWDTGAVDYSECTVGNPSCGYDYGYNDSSTGIIIYGTGKAILDYNYSINSNSGTLFAIIWGGDGATNEYAQIYNFTSNRWYDWLTNPPAAATSYSVPINTTSGLINSDGALILRLNATQGNNPLIEIYDTYVSYITNTISCGNLRVNVSCLADFTVNATGSLNSAYKVGVLFNSTNTTIFNHTSNATVQITGGVLVVNLTYPPGMTVDQNTTFNVNATVTCRNTACGNVNGTVRYNASSAYPDTSINSTQGATPFYNTSGAILQSCGTMSKDQFCQLNWTLNATGNPIVGYKIGVLFNSSISNIVNNHTDNVTITIRECTEAFTIRWSTIDFGNLNPNTTNNNATGNPEKTYNISNTGTCNLKIWIKGTNLQNTTVRIPSNVIHTIGVGNLTWNNVTNSTSSAYSLTTDYRILNSSFVYTIRNITTYYWLTIPPMPAGGYNGTVTYCANTTQLSGLTGSC
jgi:hypothetical protein